MAINTTLAGLSQNQALNGPDGATDLPSQYDNAIRYALSFTAQLRDGVGFTAGAIVAGLGYTPVQQGGGTGQGSNKVYIGWLGTTLGLQIDSTNYGATWPIGISGNAATATTATNSSQLGGQVAAEYVRRASSNAMTIGWTGSRVRIGVDGAFFSNIVPMDISGNAATATNATSATNATTANNALNLGGTAAASFIQYGSANRVSVGSPRGTGSMGSAIPNLDNRVGYFSISGPDLVVDIDGTIYAINKTVSDERLKTNVRAAQVDSVADIEAIRFAAFDFNDVSTLLAGQRREIGVIAQQVEAIRPDWVRQPESPFEFKQLNTEVMLMDALHAIQQLTARVQALEAKGA